MNRIHLRRLGLAAAALGLLCLALVTFLRLQGARDLERAARDFEAAVGPLELAAYRPPPAPAAENAAAAIEEAVELLEATAADREQPAAPADLRALNRRPLAAWTGEDRERVRGLVQENARALTLLHRAARRPASSFDLDYAAGPTMPIPPLLPHLRAGDLLLAEANLAWLEGRHEAGLAATEGLGAMGRALGREPPLVFQLFARWVERLHYRSIQNVLALGGLDGPALRRLRGSGDPIPARNRFLGVLGAEAALLYSIRPGGPAVGTASDGFDELPYRWLGHGYVARSLEYYQRLGEAFPSASFAALRTRPELVPPEASPLLPGTVSHFAFDWRGVIGGFKADESIAGLARLALAVALEGVASGSYPASLAGVGDSGADPFTGSGVRYERRADGSAVLSVPGAEELWREIDRRTVREDGEAPLFTWELAPPSGAPVAGGS